MVLVIQATSSDRGVGMSLRRREKVTFFKRATPRKGNVPIAWGQAITITGFLFRVGG